MTSSQSAYASHKAGISGLIPCVVQWRSRRGRPNSKRMRSTLRVECRPVLPCGGRFAFVIISITCTVTCKMTTPAGYASDSRARCSGRTPCLYIERSTMTLQASAPGLPATLKGYECPSYSCNCNCIGVAAASAWPTYGYPGPRGCRGH